MRRVLLSTALVSLVLLAACGGGGDDNGDDTPGTTGTTTTTTTADEDPGEGLEPVGSPSTATVEGGGFPTGGGEVALLVDVRVSGHDGFDRVVLEFDGDDPPSYRVGYVEPPVRQDGSGNVVDVAGEAFIVVRATPAAGYDPLSDDARETYTGPRRLSPDGTEAVREAVRVGDFEAHIAWALGVTDRLPFSVAVLEQPLRLVVDVVNDPSAGGVMELTKDCTFTEAGWEVTVPYPAGWEANGEVATDTGTVPPCRIFDPESAHPPRAHELTAFGFLVHVDSVDFDDIDGASPYAELLDEEELTVDGQRAVRREDRLTETGLRGPEGARVTTYTVDLDGAILVTRTHEVADLDYDRNREVLDAVMDHLSVDEVSP